MGGHRVKMDRLKELFEILGFDDVRTFIASGNVMFRTKSSRPEALTKKIETLLNQSLGYEVPTILRTVAELNALVSYEPFAQDIVSKGDDLYVILLARAFTPEAADLLAALRTDDDEFHVAEKEVYWLRRKPISESKIPVKAFNKALTQPGTSRNMTSLRKLKAELDR